MKALIVDDEEEFVTVLVERLGLRGIEAEFALDGVSALLKMREGSFDVVVLDLKLPGMSGSEVLRRIRKDYQDVPVLLLTGHGVVEGEVDPAFEDAFDYLLKPVDLEDLVAKMQDAVSANDQR